MSLSSKNKSRDNGYPMWIILHYSYRNFIKCCPTFNILVSSCKFVIKFHPKYTLRYVAALPCEIFVTWLTNSGQGRVRCCTGMCVCVCLLNQPITTSTSAGCCCCWSPLPWQPPSLTHVIISIISISSPFVTSVRRRHVAITWPPPSSWRHHSSRSVG